MQRLAFSDVSLTTLAYVELMKLLIWVLFPLLLSSAAFADKRSKLDESIADLQTAFGEFGNSVSRLTAEKTETTREALRKELTETERALSKKTEAVRKDFKKNSKKMTEEAREKAVHALDELTASLRRLNARTTEK